MARRVTARKVKRKAAKPSPSEAAKWGEKFEGAANRTSEWRHPDGSTITVEMRVADDSVGALVAENQKLSNDLEILRRQYGGLARQMAMLLRDSAAQARILAAYRERRAEEWEASAVFVGDNVALAT